MSFVLSGLPWHRGEKMMHELTKVEKQDNPSSPCLTPGATHMLQTAPLLALGTVDGEGRPWATLWGGKAPIAQPVAQSIVGIRILVDSELDPVVKLLYGGRDNGEILKEQEPGKMVGGLAIDLESRRRVKLFGRMVAGALEKVGQERDQDTWTTAAQAQLVVKIDQSLGNCPKYINCKKISPQLPQAELGCDTVPLAQHALDLVAKADMMFISSCHGDQDMDINIRGGPAGFVRVYRNNSAGTVLVWPEYSGNNLYQTLGNLQTSPRAGLVFPDFEMGDVLYVTGDTEVLIGDTANEIIPRSKIAVRLTIKQVRFVRKGLSFRGEPLRNSPYTPRVRYLSSEKANPETQMINKTSALAILIKKETLTPTIQRYRFSISDPTAAGPWRAGQYVALSFQEELDMGYSHMRDDDPESLNDDYLRTFTVSSRPGQGTRGEEFDITVRTSGNVTRYLSMQSERSGLEVPLLGFGGEFRIQQHSDGMVAFIAGGIGITPLLAQVQDLDMSEVRLLWSLHIQDIGLVYDAFRHHPSLSMSTSLYITGQLSDIRNGDRSKWEEVSNSGARSELRRLCANDLTAVGAKEWYVCAGTGLRLEVLSWLPDKPVHYEDFNY